ncbi:MAG: type II toxin-antitoxin system Phd/YefM family antitoxin [Alphaproteobacteria bacterium]|nr:MAG: type II toxin-antitoxin system Phd/YefM family antitoxin [Alphaproteobacteria bacterium]
MVEKIYSEHTASISELKKSPMDTVNAGEGESVAILNRNHPVFYCVPAKMYAKLLETLENAELLTLAKQRSNDPSEEVLLDDL